MKNKLFCVLEQSSYNDFDLSIYHKKIFNKEFCDYYRLNWKENDGISDFFHPNITHSEGTSLIYEKCPKNYEYYMFIDDDVLFKSGEKIKINNKSYHDPSLLIKNFLNEYNPLLASFDGPHTNCRMVNKIKNEIEHFKETNTYCWFVADADVVVFHKSVAEILLPLIYHSSTKYFKFIYYICHLLYPTKMIRCCDIFYENTRHVFKYNYSEQYSFSQSGYFILLKLHSLLNEKYKNDKFFDLMYNKVEERKYHLSVSKKYIPCKKNIECKIEGLKKIININHDDYINRKSISVYNNLNCKIKNRSLANEQNYIILHSLNKSSNLYYKIVEYVNKNKINKYVVETSFVSNRDLLDNVVDIISTDFYLDFICNVDNDSLKNEVWFKELFKIFNIKLEKLNKIKNLTKNRGVKIYKHKNLSISFIYFDDFNENNFSKII